jgi:hypothetical protein
MRTSLRLVAIVIAVAVAASTAGAKVKIKTQRDKSYDIKKVKTYAWHPTGAGDVKILQATDDQPKVILARVDPVIRSAVEQGLAARGLQPAAHEQADVYVYYYVLIGGATSSQYMGQFIGNAPEWGMPPIMGATTSVKIYEQGSLVLDFSSREQKTVVWRGTAQAELDRQSSDAEREKRLREAVGQLVQRYPK